MEKERVFRLVMIVIVIAVLVAVVYPYIKEFVPIYDPFGDKTKLVRYYACSLAICTKGCGSDVVQKICLENDTSTPECEVSCQNICDDPPQEWNKPSQPTSIPGEICGPDYSIYLSLESKVSLKGVLWWSVAGTPLECHYSTGIANVLNNLEEDEAFPKFTDLTCVRGLMGAMYKLGETHGKSMPKHTYYGGGGVFLDPNEVYEKYDCYHKLTRSTLTDTFCDTNPGFYECTFHGNLKIWSFDPDNDGCADVIFKFADEPSTGGFDLWAKHEENIIAPGEEIKIPKGQTVDFDIFIGNNLRFDSWFTLELDSLENADCGFADDEDSDNKVSISVANDDVESTKLTCEPTETGNYPIEIKAWDGAITRLLLFNIIVGDFSIDVKPDDPQIIPVGDSKTFDVYLTNNLGKEATFDLSISADPEVNCNLAQTSLTVSESTTGGTTFTCTPTDAAAGNPYTVTVTATYETIQHDDSIDISVPSCDVTELKLEFYKDSTPLDSVNSGDTFRLRASGFSGCQGKEVKFSLDHPDLEIDSEVVGDTEGNECILRNLEAQSPGTYTFYAIMNVNGVEHIASENLTIEAGEPGEMGYTEDQGDCWYDSDNICNHPTGDPFRPHENCVVESCLDPQTCKNLSPASVCCLDDEDYYCNGPDCDDYTGRSDVPCLSPDTDTHHQMTENLWWGGTYSCFPGTCYGVDNARNVLVKDGDERYAKFNVYTCDAPDDCTGGSGAPPELGSAFCDSGKCKLLTDTDSYYGWEFIRIASQDLSRSVYGVKISIAFQSGCHGGIDSAYFHVYLHEKDGNWFKIGTPDVGGYAIPAFEWGYETHNIVPPSGWSWDNIDAMFIGLGGTHDCVNDFDNSAYVDYVGLLTKDTQNTTAFCTDRPGDPDDYEEVSTPYFRVVDDGRKCYWNVDCKMHGTGWSGKKSTNIVAIKGFEDLGCKCDDLVENPDATCGKGYCEYTTSDTEVCYYSVRCAHGGWQGEKTECGSDEKCTSEGCVPE